MAQVVDTRQLFECEVSKATAGRVIDALQFWARAGMREMVLDIDWQGGHWQREQFDDELLLERPWVKLESGNCEGWLVSVNAQLERQGQVELWCCKCQMASSAGEIATELAEQMTWLH